MDSLPSNHVCVLQAMAIYRVPGQVHSFIMCDTHDPHLAMLWRSLSSPWKSERWRSGCRSDIKRKHISTIIVNSIKILKSQIKQWRSTKDINPPWGLFFPTLLSQTFTKCLVLKPPKVYPSLAHSAFWLTSSRVCGSVWHFFTHFV